MNKTAVAVTAIIVFGAVAGFYVWSSHNRYYITSTAMGLAYEVDRKTGQSWMLRGEEKILQEDARPFADPMRQRELPRNEVEKITGNAGLGGGSFSGKIYNGSDWTVTRIVFTVTATETDGSLRWTRDFAESLSIQPLTTESFYITVTGDLDIKNASWGIKKVYGYQQ